MNESKWEACAHKLASALYGSSQRHRITLAELNGEEEPKFETTPPSRISNVVAIGDALSAYQQLSGRNPEQPDQFSGYVELLIQRNQLRYYLATMMERKAHPFEEAEQIAIKKLLEETVVRLAWETLKP